MLAKTLSSIFALGMSFLFTKQFLLQSALIGVLPIWSEVAASTLTKVEPAREQRQFLLRIDALIDVTVFLLVPAAWFALKVSANFIVLLGLCFFIFCGIWRILRFLKTGLDQSGSFQGLPVTYTGYLWPVLCLLPQTTIGDLITVVLLIALSYAMISSKIRIKASR